MDNLPSKCLNIDDNGIPEGSDQVYLTAADISNEAFVDGLFINPDPNSTTASSASINTSDNGVNNDSQLTQQYPNYEDLTFDYPSGARGYICD